MIGDGEVVQVVLCDHGAAGFDPQPEVELWSFDHPHEGGLLVLKLAAFFAGFATSTGGVMNNPDSGVALVLVLATTAARAKSLDLTVMDAHTQDASSRPWLSPSMSHEATLPGEIDLYSLAGRFSHDLSHLLSLDLLGACRKPSMWHFSVFELTVRVARLRSSRDIWCQPSACG